MGKGIGALAGLGAAAQGVAHGLQTGQKINQQRRADVFADMMKGLMSDDDDAYNTAAAHFGMAPRTKKGIAVSTPVQMAAAQADNPTGQFGNIADPSAAGLSAFPERE